MEDIMQEKSPVEGVETVLDAVAETTTSGQVAPVSTPAPEQNDFLGAIKERIQSGDMAVFDDYDEQQEDLDMYLGRMGKEGFNELLSTNLSQAKVLGSKELYDSLPQQLQYAVQYVAEGGKDLKGMFASLAKSEETRALNPAQDAREIAKQYLEYTQFGDEQMIQEQLDEWEDANKLSDKAKAFKPKLDKVYEQQVADQLAMQSRHNEQMKAAADKYSREVKEQLSSGTIGGVPVREEVRSALLQGLLEPSYTSMSGNKTNLLGRLLEKYQYEEPNHALVAEALWLLSDPEGYRQSQRMVGGNKKTEDIIRRFKTQASKYATEPAMAQLSRGGVVKRRNIFSR